MNKTALIILCVFAAPSFAGGLTQVQIPQSGAMVVLPAERAHVIGQPIKIAEIDRATVVWFVTDIETPMDAVDNLEEAERLDAIEAEKIRLTEERAAAETARLAEPVDAAHGKVLFAFRAKTVRKIATLDEVLVMLIRYPDATVEVVGHTDAIGSDEANIKLGLARAAYVSAWLQKHDVAQSRILVTSKGESEPEDSNETATGRQKNRRAVVTVYVRRGQLSTETVGNLVSDKAQVESPSQEAGHAQKRGSNE
jgi:outer membrane protein OmpA-like peptidoglycan-associated protein